MPMLRMQGSHPARLNLFERALPPALPVPALVHHAVPAIVLGVRISGGWKWMQRWIHTPTRTHT